MSDEQQGKEQAVAAGIVRLRRLWGRFLDGPEVIAEYRRVLMRADDAAMLTVVIDRVIDEAGDGYLPRPGAFVKAIAEEQRTRFVSRQFNERRHPRWVLLSALDDARNFRDWATNDIDRAIGQQHVESLTRKLRGDEEAA